MNKRKFLGFLSALPAIGWAFRPADGVALNSMAHPAEFFAPQTTDYCRRCYAFAGETVTCENGHPICDFARDVVYGTMQDTKSDFGNWRQPAPQVGDFPIPGCAVCGAPFADGMVYHVGDSWRVGPGAKRLGEAT